MLERKDIRAKLDAEWHQVLSGIADADGRDLGEWVESLVVRELKRRVHEATVIAGIAARAGISGKVRE